MQDHTYSSLPDLKNTETSRADLPRTQSISERTSERVAARTSTRKPNKKKSTTITLSAALVACVITFILGFIISSSAFAPASLKDAKNTIAEQEDEIKSLETELDAKNEANILLGEKIQEQLSTIESLENGEQPVAAPVAAPANSAPEKDIITRFSELSTTQQILLFITLIVVFVFIISITCGFIASRAPKKNKKNKKRTEPPKKEEAFNEEHANDDVFEASDFDDTKTIPALDAADNYEGPADETPVLDAGTDSVVDEAIDLLYHNNLEDSISDLGGFKFGITNFEEILSDKAKGKSFGNAENGDFVAFMAVKASIKKLFIIPRYMTLSDSSVALRGTTDLFNVSDEAGNDITHGTVKIKTIDSPAVFAFGEGGWAIESKGHITALGTRS